MTLEICHCRLEMPSSTEWEVATQQVSRGRLTELHEQSSAPSASGGEIPSTMSLFQASTALVNEAGTDASPPSKWERNTKTHQAINAITARSLGIGSGTVPSSKTSTPKKGTLNA